MYSRGRQHTVGELLVSAHGIAITPEISAELLRAAEEYSEWSPKQGVHVLKAGVGSCADFAVYREEMRTQRCNQADELGMDAVAARLYDQAVYFAAKGVESRKGLDAAGERARLARTALESLEARGQRSEWLNAMTTAQQRLQELMHKINGLGWQMEEGDISRVEAPGGETPQSVLESTPPGVHLGYDPRRTSSSPEIYRGMLERIVVDHQVPTKLVKGEESSSLLPSEASLIVAGRPILLPDPSLPTHMAAGLDADDSDGHQGGESP